MRWRCLRIFDRVDRPDNELLITNETRAAMTMRHRQLQTKPVSLICSYHPNGRQSIDFGTDQDETTQRNDANQT